MEPVKLLERAATSAAHAVRHPISSASHAAGVVRGLAGAAIHGTSVRAHDAGAGTHHVPTQRRAPSAEQDVPPPEPTQPGESFATEPKATSRQSEHAGRATEAEINEWIDEAMARGDDVDIETPQKDAERDPE
jgi:hypothetical protein